jgi:hypothetical protein
MVQQVHVTWYDFWDKIDLKRRKTKATVTYIGTWDDHGKVYEADFKMTRSFFDGNLDDIDYIDNFAKEEIAKKIFVQLTKRSKQ